MLFGICYLLLSLLIGSLFAWIVAEYDYRQNYHNNLSLFEKTELCKERIVRRWVITLIAVFLWPLLLLLTPIYLFASGPVARLYDRLTNRVLAWLARP